MSHYQKHPSGIECIDIVKHENFLVGNAIKYIWRRKEKFDEVGDLRKAIYYLEKEIARLGNPPKINLLHGSRPLFSTPTTSNFSYAGTTPVEEP